MIEKNNPQNDEQHHDEEVNHEEEANHEQEQPPNLLIHPEKSSSRKKKYLDVTN